MINIILGMLFTICDTVKVRIYKDDICPDLFRVCSVLSESCYQLWAKCRDKDGNPVPLAGYIEIDDYYL